MKKDNILVTGASGLLGSYIVRYLLKSGYSNIVAIKRPTSDLGLLNDVKDKINWKDCDVMDQVGMEDIIGNIDYVIHSAAMISFVKSEVPKMMRTNVEGTAQLLNICLEKGIKKFIQISSISALGREKDGQTLDESAQWAKTRYTTNYAISKYKSEQECFRAAAEGLDVAILNPSLILGAGKWNSGSTNIFKKVYDGLSFYTSGTTGIVDVRDVAILSVKLMESNVRSERVIASGENVSYKNLMGEISSQFGKKAPAKKLNSFMQGLAWRLEYLKSKLNGEAPIITRETMRQTSAHFYFVNDKSKELFNHEYIPWEKTIKDSCDAFKKFKESGELVVLSFD